MTNADIDTHMMELAERAQSQCQEIFEAFERIEMPEDDSVEPETLRGATRTPTPMDRPVLVFALTKLRIRRTIIYVDAILDLARLILSERILDYGQFGNRKDKP